MGASLKVDGLEKLLTRAERFSGKMSKQAERIVGEVALASKVMMLAEAKSDAPQNLRNYDRKKGARIAITYPKPRKRTTGNWWTYLRPGPPKPWYLLEYGAKPHMIPKRKYRKARVLDLQGFTPSRVRGQVNHPGTKGKKTWTHGRDKAKAAAPAMFQRAAAGALIDAWKG